MNISDKIANEILILTVYCILLKHFLLAAM